MGKLCDKVLSRIKEEKIKPKPRWQFLLKNYFVWLAFAVSVLVGAISFCVIIFFFFSNDWDIYKYLKVNPFQHFIFSLPYLWIIVLLAFLALAYYNYKHTKSGYRCETYVILGLSILASVILGLLFHFGLGMGEKIDNHLSNNLPVYSRLHAYCNRQNIWSQPEKGLLGGKIKEIIGDNEFKLEDFKGLVWQIEEDEEVLMPAGFVVAVGRKVKLVGEKRAERYFWAKEIRPWEKNER